MNDRLAMSSTVAILAVIAGTALWSTYDRSAIARSKAAAPNVPAPADSGDRATEHGARAVATSAAASRARMDRKTADEMRQRLQALVARPGAGWAPSDQAPAPITGPLSATGRPLLPMPSPKAGPDDAGVTPLTGYIKDRMHEDFFPLAEQCYKNELAGDPQVAGTTVLKYRIIGDQSVGGVVDDVSIDPEKSTLKSPGFAQCLTESMMSVSFGAPPEGQVATTVAYTIAFSPGDGG